MTDLTDLADFPLSIGLELNHYGFPLNVTTDRESTLLELLSAVQICWPYSTLNPVFESNSVSSGGFFCKILTTKLVKLCFIWSEQFSIDWMCNTFNAVEFWAILSTISASSSPEAILNSENLISKRLLGESCSIAKSRSVLVDSAAPLSM